MLFFNSNAPCNAAPEELPTNNPSLFATSLTLLKASLSATVKIPSTNYFSKNDGHFSEPIPSVA